MAKIGSTMETPPRIGAAPLYRHLRPGAAGSCLDSWAPLDPAIRCRESTVSHLRVLQSGACIPCVGGVCMHWNC